MSITAPTHRSGRGEPAAGAAPVAGAACGPPRRRKNTAWVGAAALLLSTFARRDGEEGERGGGGGARAGCVLHPEVGFSCGGGVAAATSFFPCCSRCLALPRTSEAHPESTTCFIVRKWRLGDVAFWSGGGRRDAGAAAAGTVNRLFSFSETVACATLFASLLQLRPSPPH